VLTHFERARVEQGQVMDARRMLRATSEFANPD
jgi:hypothetical protein